MISYTIVFDGGSQGNPGRAYGSFVITRSGKRTGPPQRKEFGRGTNNEAEYLALLAGLEELNQQLVEQGISPAEVNLKIFGDSSLVINQLDGSWKTKDVRMRTLKEEALEQVSGYHTVQFIHQPRYRSYAVLGH
jgi:ribonuclease HI